MGDCAKWCDKCGWGAHSTHERGTHATPAGFSRWPCENCGRIGHKYEHCNAPRDRTKIIRCFEIRGDKRVKRQRAAIELGRAVMSMGKSTTILPEFIQRDLEGINLQAASPASNSDTPKQDGQAEQGTSTWRFLLHNRSHLTFIGLKTRPPRSEANGPSFQADKC